GCLERYCSTGALVEDAKRAFEEHPESGLSQYKNLTYFDIFNEYEKMDPLAVSLVTQACCYAGYGVVNLIHAYNPDVVVLGNVLTRAKDALEENVRKVLAERISPELVEKVEIRTEEPGSNSVLYGCAMYAIDHLIDSVLAQ
nr:ROK family protein [Lachnospiraceae bacterium]